MKNTQRLDRLLSNLGYGTRSENKKIIREGAVRVDGVTVRDGSTHVDPLRNVIEINGELLHYREFTYIMMNKPAGIISATCDIRHRTVLDILPEKYRKIKLFPVGRLDIDTEGLLLLTNDGQLAHRLLSPKKHVPKKYYALVAGALSDEDVARFREGIILDDGYRTLPAELCILRKGMHSEAEIVIYEGKFHQVKRMFEALDKKVKYLKRTAMGEIELDDNLEPGEVRELTDDEVECLKKHGC